MSDMHEMDRAEMIERAKARIDAMNQAAEELTQELGLPPEAKYDVLSVMYSQEDDKHIAASKAYAKNKRRDNGEDMPHRDTFMEPKQIGNYRLVRLLGRGGFAEVYLGEHELLRGRKQAAIKVLYANLGSEERRRFHEEACLVAQLDHPGIVRLQDYALEGDTPYLIMDYAPGGTLRQSYPTGTKLPLDTVVSYVKQIAAALQYAHSQGIIHRDVKPENVLLQSTNKVLLSDFGIATIIHTSDQNLQTIAGTIPYMAPEQLNGQPCPASDQYSLGIIAYELLSGTRPFTGSLGELVAQHRAAPPAPLRDKVPTIPSGVEQVIMKTLEKDPTQRHSSVEAFANALEEANKAILTPSYVEQARIFLREGNYGKALACYENAIGLDSQNAQFHRGRAATLQKLQRDEDALNAYEEAIQLDLTNPYLYKEKGDTQRKLNQLEEALACYIEATHLDPSFGLAYQCIGEIHEQLSKQAYEKAKALKGSQSPQQMKR